MPELKFKNDENAMERLSKAQSAIDEYSDSHLGEFSEKEHKEFRKLLNDRASALSEATGMKIHSLFEDED